MKLLLTNIIKFIISFMGGALFVMVGVYFKWPQNILVVVGAFFGFIIWCLLDMFKKKA